MVTGRSTLLKGLAGALAVFAVMPILFVPFVLPAIFRFTVALLLIAFVFRASVAKSRRVWWLGIAAFGLLTIGAVSNEFHGKPTLILHFFIGWWAFSFTCAFAGLKLDKFQKCSTDQG